MVAAVVAAAVSGGFAAAAGITVFGLSFAVSAFVIAGGSLALGFVQSALAKTSGGGIPGFQVEARDRTQLARNTAVKKTLVLGEVQIAGPLVEFEASGAANEFLHVAVPHSLGPCDAFREFYVNDELIGDQDGSGNVTSGRFDGHLRLVGHTGAFDQAADADLVDEVEGWSAADAGGGVAYTAARLKWSQDVWPNGFSNLKAVLRGILLFDPRDTALAITTSTGDTLSVFSTTAAHGRAAGDVVWIKGHVEATPTAPPFGKMYQIKTVPGSQTFTLIDRDGNDVGVGGGGSGGTMTAMAWSDNWALCVRMWLTHWAGYNYDDDDIDDTQLIAAANICDEQVSLTPQARAFTVDAADDILTVDAAVTWKGGDGVTVSTDTTLPAPLLAATTYFIIRVDKTRIRVATTLENARARVAIDITDAGTGIHTVTRDSQLRYTCNGVVTFGGNPLDVLEDLMTAGAGVVVEEGGIQKVYAGAATASSATVTVADFRAAELEINPTPEFDKMFNGARGKFVSPDDFWANIGLPPYQNQTYVDEDGEEIFTDLTFPFTTDIDAGQRLLKINVERARQGITVKWPAKPRKLETAVWDVEALTVADLGWAAKEFRVLGWKENPDFGIDITYREEAPAVWDWDLGDETVVDPAPDTNLPSPFTVSAPTGLALFSGTAQLLLAGDGTVISRVLATWTAPADAFVTSGGRIDVQFKKSSATEWEKAPAVPGDETTTLITGVLDGVSYDVRVRSVNTLGAAGDWEQVNGHTVIGKSEDPPRPDTFTVKADADGGRVFEFALAPLPADVRAGGGFKIRFLSSSTSDWSAMTPLHDGLLISSPFETNQLAAGTYWFAIKTIDSSGNESTDALFINAAILPDPRIANALLIQDDRALVWLGTRVSAYLSDNGGLRATGSGNFTNLPATFTALPAQWRGIVARNSPLDYTTEEIDLGLDVTFRPLVSVAGSGTQTITMQTGTDADGQATGAFVALDTVTARYLKVKVSMAGTTPGIDTMVTIVDAPTKVETFDDVDTSAASAGHFERIATGHFKLETKGGIASITQAQITALQNTGAGFTWELISKATTITGGSGAAAEFKIYNASSVLADATVDVRLLGTRST